jgi:hypothetical protein
VSDQSHEADRPYQSCSNASPICHIFGMQCLTTVTQHCNTLYTALYAVLDLGCCIGNASLIPWYVPDETYQGNHNFGMCSTHNLTHLCFEVFLQLIDAHSQVEVQLHGTILHLHVPAHSTHQSTYQVTLAVSDALMEPAVLQLFDGAHQGSQQTMAALHQH